MPFARVKTDFGLNRTNDIARDAVILPDGKIIVVGEVNGQIAMIRYNADATLDTTFHLDGKINTIDTASAGAAYAVSRQGDGKIVLAVDTGGGDFKLARYNTDGSLDITFGVDGFVTTDMGGVDTARDVIIQADGKIVLVGGNGADFAIARYDSDGALDTTLDGTGKLTVDTSGTDGAASVVVQADGKIVVAGTNFIGSSPNFSIVRYNSNGTLDTSFSGDGIASASFGFNDIATSMALQADGKFVVAGFTNLNNATTGLNDFGVMRFNADGTLDTTFSGNGKVISNVLATRDDQAASVAIQSDGKILVAGTGSGDFAIIRYNSDGSEDLSFNFDGRAVLSYGGLEQGFSVKVQADGKIVLVGTSNYAGNSDFTFLRLLADGSVDSSFVGAIGTGRDSLDIGLTATNDIARDVALLSGGKFVVVGETDGGMALARYNADGTLDTTFSGDGKVIGPAGTIANAVDAQTDGKIVVAGIATGGGDFQLARYGTDGTLDATFGTAGLVTTDFGGIDKAQDVVIQADGKIVVIGTSGADFAIARFNANGTADLAFGAAGKLITNSFQGDAGAGVVVQPDGKIVVAGTSSIGSSPDFSMLRYNSDGSLDNAFSGDGKFLFTFGADDTATSIAQQADGKFVIAGYTTLNSGATGINFAVARVNANGTLDTTFSGDGLLTTDVLGGLDQANSVAIQSDGKILVGGTSTNDFAIVRYNSDGSLDTTFNQTGKTNFTFGATDIAFSIKLLADGKILLVGQSSGNTTNNDNDFALARLNADGTLDTTFAGNGENWIGTAAFDFHTGSGANDTLNGLGGSDNLNGDLGNDTINGGSGNDSITGGAGGDTLDGGSNSAVGDTLFYTNSAAGISINLLTSLAQGGDAQGDTFTGFENVTGSAFGDQLVGDDGANVLTGGTGNDLLVGGLGADTLIGGNDLDVVDYSSFSAGVFVNLTTGTATGGDTLSQIENIIGSAFGDVLDGDSEANTMRGGGGNDFLVAGNGADLLIGGADNDEVSYATATTGVFVNLTTGTGANGGVLQEIENIRGSNFGDVLQGDNGANTIRGLDGNDFIIAGNGADLLIGGNDNDTVSYETATAGIFANLTTGIGANGGVLQEIENLTGSNFGDVLIGSSGGNTLKGGGGNDFIVGNSGSDALYGGADNDTFRFETTTFGNDVITDFQDNGDKLSFAAAVATNFSQFTILNNNTTNVTVQIAGQSIVVQGVANISLTAGDFLFV